MLGCPADTILYSLLTDMNEEMDETQLHMNVVMKKLSKLLGTSGMLRGGTCAAHRSTPQTKGSSAVFWFFSSSHASWVLWSSWDEPQDKWLVQRNVLEKLTAFPSL